MIVEIRRKEYKNEKAPDFSEAFCGPDGTLFALHHFTQLYIKIYKSVLYVFYFF